jgi:hypothetical protein
MTNRILEFINEARALLQPAPAMEALQNPLGGLVGLVQAGPGSPRSKTLRALAQAIFDASDELSLRNAGVLDRTALLVTLRLAEEHLACRYSGEEWAEAFKAMDEAIRKDAGG